MRSRLYYQYSLFYTTVNFLLAGRSILCIETLRPSGACVDRRVSGRPAIPDPDLQGLFHKPLFRKDLRVLSWGLGVLSSVRKATPTVSFSCIACQESAALWWRLENKQELSQSCAMVDKSSIIRYRYREGSVASAGELALDSDVPAGTTCLVLSTCSGGRNTWRTGFQQLHTRHVRVLGLSSNETDAITTRNEGRR